MSSEESTTAVTPQHSAVTSTTVEDDHQQQADTQQKETTTTTSEPSTENASVTSVESHQSETIVVGETQGVSHTEPTKGSSLSDEQPLSVCSSTPVIKVVTDSSHESNDNVENVELRRPPPSSSAITGNQSASSQNTSSASFLHAATSPEPTNPFLRTSSFSSTSLFNSASADQSDLNSDIFAPPKLLTSFTSSTLFDSGNTVTGLSTPSVAVCDGEGKSTETISTSKTFISLNKEDIGKIKTPSFVTNSLEKTSTQVSNGLAVNTVECDNSNTVTDTDKPSFVFGQGLKERVVFDSKPSMTVDFKSFDPNSSSTTTSENLISFSDVTNSGGDTLKDLSSDSIKSDEFRNDSDNSSGSLGKNGETTDAVFKRKYEVITGEEDEQNVLSIHGKLYAWDNDKTSWVEKGRGHLRLNDVIKNERLCSRLVMRTTGALRVILNAHIVAGMKFELANDNCLRFTYIDGIYLIKANPKDVDQLHSAIEHRLREITKRIKTDSDLAEAQTDSPSASN